MTEAESSKNVDLPGKDTEQTTGSTSVEVNTHWPDAVDAVTQENKEDLQMSDPSHRTVSTTTGITSQVSEWSTRSGLDTNVDDIDDIDVDPSVAIAVSGLKDNGDVSGPSDNTPHQLELQQGNDSQMNLNDVNMDPSVAIAGSGFDDKGSDHGSSGNTPQAEGNDRPGALVRGISSRFQLVQKKLSTVLKVTPGSPP